MAHGGHSHGGGHGHGHAETPRDLQQPLLKDCGHEHGHSHDHDEEKRHGHGDKEHGQGHADHKGHSHDDDDHGHSHSHGHGHGHRHEGETDDDQARLKKAVFCALFFMTVEIVGGCVANSLAIITDAAHMLSDVGGFIVSLVALQLSAMAKTEEYTYGFKQAEVLGALLSVAIVWALTAVLLWNAIPRFLQPEEIDGKTMLIISVIGLLVNLVLMQVLGHGHSHGGDDHGHAHGDEDSSVAVQAALAHVIGDIVQSLGVCVAAFCIWWHPFDIGEAENGVSNWNYADPICTCLFGVIVLYTTKSTFVRTIETLMGKAPKKINQEKLLIGLESIPNVNSVHDLHVWSIGSADVICTAHLVMQSAMHSTEILQEAINIARKAGIGHSTFQLEVVGELQVDCGGCEGESSPRRPQPQDGHGHSHGEHGHSGHSCCG